MERVIRGAYDQRRPVRVKTGAGTTQQHYKAECDINNIMRRFNAGQEITHVNPATPQYGAVGAQTFTEAMFLVKDTEREFYKLPSEIRKEFMNDASLYLDAISDPDQAGKLRELGLLPPEPAIQPDDNTLSAETPPEEPSRAAEAPAEE